MKTIEHIISDLHSMANPSYVPRMEHFGIPGKQALGIKNGELKPYAKTLGKSQELAEELWDKPIHEAKLLAILLADPKKIAASTAEKWVEALYSWDICDGLGMKLFPKTPFAIEKAIEWSKREPEFEKRAAFATMVGLVFNKKIDDAVIISFFPLMEREAWDNRNFVKKAINWSLRQAGKRNSDLNEKAIECAIRIRQQGSKAAKWIAGDAIRELESELIQERLSRKQKRADKKSAPFTTNPD